MKRDCSKTTVFLREKTRACKMQNGTCVGCPLHNGGTICTVTAKYINEETIKNSIELIQAWSDRNPTKTMMEKFNELFPNADKHKEGYPRLCPSSLGWSDKKDCSHMSCIECWDREYRKGDK